MKNILLDNFKTILYALIIAILIRSILFQPFYIPSSSMEPNLLVGDRLFASKYSYGYSRHSFPFSPKVYSGRIFKNMPDRGDIIVFKTPMDNRTDYIKRLIGIPGDTIQFKNGDLYLNNKLISRKVINNNFTINCGDQNFKAIIFEETLPNNKKYLAAYRQNGTLQNTDQFIVPSEHYFFMGDNRDCSKDSRFLSSVGYVSFDNFVGKANMIFFSNDKEKGSFYKFWKWNSSLRFERFFEKIK